MSSYLVSDQNPRVFSSGGSRSDSAGRLQNTGVSRRSTANAASRSSGDCSQNERAARSIGAVLSDTGIPLLKTVPPQDVLRWERALGQNPKTRRGGWRKI